MLTHYFRHVVQITLYSLWAISMIVFSQLVCIPVFYKVIQFTLHYSGNAQEPPPITIRINKDINTEFNDMHAVILFQKSPMKG